MTDPKPIIDHLRMFFEPGDVFEIRVLDAVSPYSTWAHTESGYFEYEQIDVIPNCLDNFQAYGGVYVTMNPVNPDLLARANNRLKPAKRDTSTKDGDVLRRRWMLVDIDPKRSAGISANDTEKAIAFDKAIEIQEGLASMGFPAPIVVDSGNGMQLLYRVNLPADDGGLVQRCLKALNPCSNEKVHVDLGVHNAARICRLPGTKNCKGDETASRKHRVAEVLETPKNIEVVSEALLQKLATTVAEEKAASSNSEQSTPATDFNLRGEIEPILEKHGWTLIDETDQQLWLRPGNPTNKYSAKYDGKTFYVHSSNAEPFGVGPNSRFDVYTKLEHGGDKAAAISALVAQGYGPRDDDVDISGLLAKFDTVDPSLSTSPNEPKKRGFYVVRTDQIKIRPPEWLIRGILERNTTAMVFGDPGGGKSFLAIDWACRIATGTPWQNRRVQQAPVVYLAGEGERGFRIRTKAWEITNDISIDEKPLFAAPAVAIPDPAQLADVVSIINEEVGRPSLIVLDTLARNFGDGDENSTQDMSRFVAACDAIRREYDATMLIVHHTGHSDKNRARGAIAMKAALDAEYHLVNDGTGQLLLSTTKMKEAEIPPPLAMELLKVDLPDVFDEDGEIVSSATIVVPEVNVDTIVAQAQGSSPNEMDLDGFVDRCVAAYDPCSKRSIRYEAARAFDMSERKADETLELAMERDLVSRIRVGSQMQYVKNRAGVTGDKGLWAAAILAHEPEKSAQEIAQMVGVSERYVRRLRGVIDEAPTH